ncbi:MAG: lamin tail domain-containing protein [Opitutales bacterium]
MKYLSSSALLGLFGLAVSPSVHGSLIFTEIMYDPANSEFQWEWIELYNAGSAPIELGGYVFDDDNGSALTAGLPVFALGPGAFVVLFDDDAADKRSLFQSAWGGGFSLLGISEWSRIGLNNGGEQISLWSTFADYDGDHEVHANALLSFDYPDLATDGYSIYLTDYTADPLDPTNWAKSEVGVAGAFAGGLGNVEVGSPGTGPVPLATPPSAVIPEPSSLLLTLGAGFAGLLCLRRRR